MLWVGEAGWVSALHYLLWWSWSGGSWFVRYWGFVPERRRHSRRDCCSSRKGNHFFLSNTWFSKTRGKFAKIAQNFGCVSQRSKIGSFLEISMHDAWAMTWISVDEWCWWMLVTNAEQDASPASERSKGAELGYGWGEGATKPTSKAQSQACGWRFVQNLTRTSLC